MVDLAFSTNAYTEFALPEAVRRIGECGYAGVELLGDEPHAFFPAWTDADREALADALAEAALTVANVNANTAMGYYDDAPPSAFFEPSVITADDAAREWRVEYTKRAIDLADAVDAPAVCLATGRPLPGNPPECAREHLLDSLAEILDYGEPRDVRVGIEFEPELLVECTDEALALIEAVGRESLGVNLDVGHAAVSGEDLAESVRRCAGRLTGLHLEDIAGGIGGKHYHLPPGEGDLDFRAIFDALDDVGYDGFATLELYTYPDEPDRVARESFEALSAYV
ncbi:MAG: sugar phosphate isomerase/epimerase family protein [Haloarculaceae archaeon]